MFIANMERDNYIVQALSLPNSKRYVVEDSITKVTSDGEPHGMMTMVAGLSGLVAAIIILAVLVSMVACRKQKTQQQEATALTGVKESPGKINTAFVESTLTLSAFDDSNSSSSNKQTTITVERF
ncbi:uncharacterized protein LOC108606717 isoform X1 [Drosophila busckii]|uniref:uncharacterized protein LOC108606717 isoform X1 n=2 Tax=Drosophila busckii TaxID=30019 RepID=UPI00083ED150|nr:uncharacterized protein LOC108606717 isoform X1 [Drosophila busckii]